MRKAVIDVGSNSVLLLVAERQVNRWVPVFESTAVTSLGEGTKESGVLSDRAIRDTLDAIAEAYRAARDRGADSVHAAATMAARIASNTPEFLQRAQAQGTPVEVLSGDEEAELGFLAVASDPMFSHLDRISIVDVGGHSTEMVTAHRSGDGWKERFRKSYAVGTLGLRGGILKCESPDFAARLTAVGQIDDTIGLSFLPRESGHAVALGATGTNLVTIREQMSEWDPDKVHGAWLDYEEVGKAVGWLCDMTDAERAAVRGMEKGREKTIHIGALVLERFLFGLRAPGCSVSVRGWRHALLERMH